MTPVSGGMVFDVDGKAYRLGVEVETRRVALDQFKGCRHNSCPDCAPLREHPVPRRE
jgi:hypothetical protein